MAHGFVMLSASPPAGSNAPLYRRAKNVTAPVGLLFAIVSTNSQGWGFGRTRGKFPEGSEHGYKTNAITHGGIRRWEA